MRTSFRAVFGAVALALLAVGGPSRADERDEGYLAYGKGDYPTALRYWTDQAQLGNAAAQYNLALMYDRGEGVPQSYDESIKWTRLSAEQGNHAAQLRLGMILADGRGLKRDVVEAAKWFQRSAEQGNSQAQYNLGAMYETGRGVARDMVEAHKWFNLAAANSGIGWDRADAYVSRDRVAGLLTPAQLAEAQKRAQDWKPRSAQTQAQVQ